MILNTAKEGTGTDYWAVCDSNGYLKVAPQAGGAGAMVDDAAFTPATSEITMMGAFADESSPDSVNEGDGGAVRMSLDRMLLVQASGRAAEDAAAAGNPLLCGGRYDSTARALETGDAGAIALDVAGRVIAVGPAAENAAVAGGPQLAGGRYDTAARTLDNGDVGAVALDVAGRMMAVGPVAENANAVGNPLLAGGRYDASDRTLNDTDVGGLALDVAGRAKVAGAAAHDATAVGNPVRVGGVYRTSLPTGTANDILDLLMDVAGRQIVIDGGGQEVTALASAERTETTNSSDLTNPGARGVILTLDCTAITDTPSITLSVTYKDPVGGNYEAIFSAAAAVEAVGVHTYLIYPADVAASDDIVEVTKLSLPRTWRVTVTHADADAATYSVAGSYLL